jgi:PAS domain S-box-containing protein
MIEEEELKILIVEDNEGDALLIQEYIKEVFTNVQLSHAWNLAEAENCLNNNQYNLIFLDVSLPDSSGKDSIIRVVELANTTPVIVLTGYSDLSFAVESMQLGVQDYLNKENITAISLQKSINYSIERNRIRQQLIDSDKRFQSIVENSIDGFALISAEGQIQELSPYGNSIIGYDPLENAGLFQMDFLHPDDRKMVLAIFFEVLSKPGSIKLSEFRYKRLDGGYRWMESTFYNLLENSAVKAIVLNYRDVTNRKKEEEERQLLIEQLTQTNDYLKQFGFIISHNLRAPLTNLLAISDLINPEKIPDEQTSALFKAVKISSVQLNDTLNDIIKVLIVREQKHRNLEEISLSHAWAKFLSLQKSIITIPNCEIVTDFENPTHVYFDKEYLESIFTNLLSNAIKFASAKRTLSIKVRSFLSGTDTVIEFSDNGIGFNYQMVKERIFGLHQRFHDTIGGKGFGLYLIHSLVTSLGGSIRCESEVEKGTHFYIHFKNSKHD